MFSSRARRQDQQVASALVEGQQQVSNSNSSGSSNHNHNNNYNLRSATISGGVGNHLQHQIQQLVSVSGGLSGCMEQQQLYHLQHQYQYQQQQNRYAQTISRARSHLHRMIPIAGPPAIKPSSASSAQPSTAKKKSTATTMTKIQQQQPQNYQFNETNNNNINMNNNNQDPNYNTYAYPLPVPMSRPRQFPAVAMLPAYGGYNEPAASMIDKHSLLNKPLCRCRVMYLGSSVPHITKNGLHGIQEPLKLVYPDEQFSKGHSQATSITNENATTTTIDISHLSSSLGIDSWLSVWSNGLLLENVDEFGREMRRFFSIESLHYCAAVRFFDTSNLMTQEQLQNPIDDTTMKPRNKDQNNNDQNINELNNDSSTINNGDETNNKSDNSNKEVNQQPGGTRKSMVRFLPLDAPLFQVPGMVDANHPPVFASIMRRTTGIKVLECHAFICRRDAAANALVRCCTHAYADFLNARRLSLELGHPLSSMPGASIYTKSSLASRSKTLGTKSTSATSKRRGDMSRLLMSHHHQQVAAGQSGNSTGSTTNNTTTSNEENSLEASSEDNYAIIARGNNGRSGAHSLIVENPIEQQAIRKLGDVDERQQSKKKQQQQHRKEKQMSTRAQQRKAKGSSRSLYDDFQPKLSGSYDVTKEQHLSSSNGAHHLYQEMDKLSHSLDHLQVAPCSDPTMAATTTTTGEDVSYSVAVGHRNKRYSSSMQNLDGPFQFTVTNPSIASSGLARSPKSRRNQRGTARSSRNQDGYRKTASYQDMRRNSIGSDITVRSSELAPDRWRSQLMTCKTSGCREDEIGSELASDNNQAHEVNSNGHQRYSIASSSATMSNYLRQHAPIVTGERQVYVPNNSEILKGSYHNSNYNNDNISYQGNKEREQQQQQQSGSRVKLSRHRDQSCPSKSTAHHNHRSRRAELERAYDSVTPALNHQQPHQTMMIPPQPRAPYSSYHPMGPVYGNLGPAHLPPYLPAGYYMPNYSQPIQGPGQQPLNPLVAGSIYDSPYMQPAPPLPMPLPHYAIPPNQLMTPEGLYQSRIYGNLNEANTMGPIRSNNTTKGNHHHNNNQSNSKTLARFRCLSPPVNFLNGLIPNGQHQDASNNDTQYKNNNNSNKEVASLTNPPVKLEGHAAVANSEAEETKPEPRGAATAATNGQLSSPPEIHGEELDIVSAAPGFLSSTATVGRRGGGQRKMSWIKRLSLTMSNGGGEESDSNNVVLSPDHSNSQTANQNRKKRSSLFMGSLTLGRSKSRQQQHHGELITSPT